jgi:hypothetical protein
MLKVFTVFFLLASLVFGGGSVIFLGGAAAFSPTSLTGLVAFFDCKDTSSMTLSGSNITQLNDLSGNAHHATQVTGTKQPLSQNDGCYFDGTDDRLAIDLGANLTSYSAFIVMKSSRQRRFDALLDSNTGTAGDTTMETGAGNNTLETYINGSGAVGTTTGTWSLSTIFDGIWTYNASTFTTYLNNAGSTATASAGKTFRRNITMGGDIGLGGYYYWKDYIYAVVITNAVFSSTDRSNLRTWAKARWSY